VLVVNSVKIGSNIILLFHFVSLVFSGAQSPNLDASILLTDKQELSVIVSGHRDNWVVNRSDVLVSFFTQVADKSPLPIVIYNFPTVTQQMDTPQDTVVQLAAHKNIVGIKCTDGNVGKAAYVCSKANPKQFTLMSGSAESFLPFLSVGAQGVVPGLGNVIPRTIVRLFELYTNNSTDQWEEIQRLQALIVAPDHAFFRWNGISAVKSVMQSVLGYGGLPRAPLLPTSQELQEKILKVMEPALAFERQLASKSSNK